MPSLNLKFKTRYGLDWPRDVHDIFIDLILAKKARLEPYCHGNLFAPGEHMLRAARELFDSSQWNLSPWTELHCHAFCDYDASVWLGAASTSKSSDAGFLAFLYWLTDPTTTYVAMGSTSVPMLKLRSFESVTRCFRILKQNPYFLIPGKESPSQTAIINEQAVDDPTSATVKASVRGVALADGDESRAVARLAGGHLPFTALILDEGSALPPAAANARFNAAAGAQRFVFLSLANPADFNDEACRLAEPEGGWGTVDENTPEWISTTGMKVLHHNGFASPAITEPDGARKYPYLINQTQIDRMIRESHGNADSPLIWTMVKGFPPPVGMENTVLSAADVMTFRMAEKAVWAPDTEPLALVAGLDPAFTNGGDNAVYYPLKVGRFREGVVGVEFQEPVYLPIEAGQKRPAAYQVVDAARKQNMLHGVAPSDVGVDDSGTQSVAAIMQVEGGVRPVPLNFSSRAMGLVPGDHPTKAGQARFANLVTEIWMLVAELGRQGRVRGFRGNIQSQFCARRFRKGFTPLALETKAEYRKHSGGASPDEGDAGAIALATAVIRGFISLNPDQRNPGRSGLGDWARTMFGARVSKIVKASYDSGFDIVGRASYNTSRY